MSTRGHKIVFLGYGEVGVRCLRALARAGAEIAGVLPRTSDTRTDDPLRSVRSAADAMGLRVLEFRNASDPECVHECARMRPDLIVSLQYDRILRPQLIAVPTQGCLNMHFAPLPRLRGCFPTKWAIIDNERSGVTLHYIDEGIDTGPIIDQLIVELSPRETDQSLYARLVESAVVLFERHVNAIAMGGLPQARAQDHTLASYHPKRVPHDGVIDWTWPSWQIDRFVRAFTFPPYPAAKTWWGSAEVQIRGPLELEPYKTNDLCPGDVTWDRDSCMVACGQGRVRLRTAIVVGETGPADLPIGALRTMSPHVKSFCREKAGP